ncbi:MAG: hypothetical protein HY22_03630 [[Candidatus Thermochlorobacteriaceae] bacterium GBChlB]|nr:MAG: hypothetical protein HY22_03630 [[Candidatus Thermochlorobacteriaceae] bacterium GBChlB]
MKRLCFALLVCLLALKAPAVAQSDLKKFFKEYAVEGSITIYDLRNDRWIFSDEADARRKTLPASTFKIVNSLIALEIGAVKSEKEIIRWDSVPRLVRGQPIKAWNADTDMETAYKNSTVWFYVELAKRIGKEKYAEHLERCNYGNGKIYGGEGADFWNYGEFGVSPAAQIEFLKKLQRSDLPFSTKTLETVRRIMIAETTNRYTLRGKTGWTSSNGNDIGWWVGYYETNGNTYFFATRITKQLDVQNDRFGACRKEITQKIFSELNLIP